MQANALVRPIFFRTIVIRDDFSGRDVELSGWSYEGDPGLYDSYISAVAAQSGCWEEYCELNCRRAYEEQGKK